MRPTAARWPHAFSATASSSGSVACSRMSNSRNTRMPAETPFRKHRSVRLWLRMRPTGSPRKIVTPAIAPRRTVWPVLNALLLDPGGPSVRTELRRTFATERPSTARILLRKSDSRQAYSAADRRSPRSGGEARIRRVSPSGGGSPKRLFLLDGHSLSYRAFFALPTSLATSIGQVTNAVYGFTSMLIKLLAEERPDLIAVAFDVGRPTVRLERYAEYKAGRPETPDEFRQQLGLIVEV